MLESVKEERSRHFRMALRVGLPLIFFIFLLIYIVFFHEETIDFTAENITIFAAMLFVIVYFIFFALELSRKETLLDRVTEGYHYDSFLKRILATRPKTLAAVQIGNLSSINETFGVGKADQVLKELVALLNKRLFPLIDSHGYIGRKTGAELLLAVECEPEKVKEELSRFAREHHRIDGVETELNFAVIRNNIEDPSKALEQLRDLLVRQESRRDQRQKTIPDARELSHEEHEVIEALEKGALSLSFRPLLNLHTGKRQLYEVGVRMNDSRGRHIPPRDFLPIINRNDLGQHYDLLIFRRLLTLAPLTDKTLAFSFNLSPFSLRDDRFRAKLLEALNDSGVSSQRLIIELYERRRHHRLEEYLADLKRIKQEGLRLCLDNFGSSNASMEYLRHFPFDMIQFDREYTKELESEKNLSVLKSFVAMARDMGIETVAKWVDNREKIEILRSIGIDYIQGYAAGKVLNESELLKEQNPLSKGN